MLKMSVSPETSSENEDVENALLMFGSSKDGVPMSVSPETSSQNGDLGGRRSKTSYAENERFA